MFNGFDALSLDATAPRRPFRHYYIDILIFTAILVGYKSVNWNEICRAK